MTLLNISCIPIVVVRFIQRLTGGLAMLVSQLQNAVWTSLRDIWGASVCSFEPFRNISPFAVTSGVTYRQFRIHFENAVFRPGTDADSNHSGYCGHTCMLGREMIRAFISECQNWREDRSPVHKYPNLHHEYWYVAVIRFSLQRELVEIVIQHKPHFWSRTKEKRHIVQLGAFIEFIAALETEINL